MRNSGIEGIMNYKRFEDLDFFKEYKMIRRDGLMKLWRVLFTLFIGFNLISVSYGASTKASGKKRLIVVDSYHREYLWSQYTHEGFCEAMLKLGYFDNKDQIAEYTKNDFVVSSRVVIKKLWMDSKRKNSKEEKAETTAF